jgi:hypothetical protein
MQYIGDREHERSIRNVQFTELLLCISYFPVVILIVVVTSRGTDVTPYFSEFSVDLNRTAVDQYLSLSLSVFTEANSTLKFRTTQP